MERDEAVPGPNRLSTKTGQLETGPAAEAIGNAPDAVASKDARGYYVSQWLLHAGATNCARRERERFSSTA
jgi:hypothetical protein